MSKISKRPIRKIDKPGPPGASKKRKKAATPDEFRKAGAANPQTRAAILELLKRQGEMSAPALGEALGVTPMAARLHLYALDEEGLVSPRPESADAIKGRGRPTLYWSLTEASAKIFPDAHQGLAVAMIKSVEELFGAEGLAKLVKKHGDMQRAAYGEKLNSASSLGDKVKRLAAARTAEGYMAEAKKDGRDWLLIENHCPICSAAKACTGLCAGELKVFSDVLGKDVKIEREEHILSGARRCAYRVRAK